MSRTYLPIARIFGIPVGLDYSWFLIFVLLTWSLGTSYFPDALPGRPVAVYVGLGAVAALLLFASVLLHELGHAVVAMHYAIPVRRITLFIFGGVAQIGGEPPTARVEFWIALAGPVVSAALAAVFRAAGAAVPVPSAPAALARYLASVNFLLAVFNLVPGFPLDGGLIFRAILWATMRNFRRATLAAASVGRAIAFGFILLGAAQIFAGNVAGGVWIAFIGWFLDSAAAGQAQQQVVEGLLSGHTVAEAMNRDYAAVAPAMPLADLVDRHILGGGRRCFVVTRGDDEVVGLVTLHQVKGVPRDRWATTTAEGVMTPIAQVRRTRPDAELWAAMEEMERDGVNQLPVTVDGRILGMLSRDDVITFLRTLEEFGVSPAPSGKTR